MAGDAEIQIDLVVVGSDIGVGNRPVHAVAVAAGGFKIVVGQTQRQPSPDISFAAQAARAHPGVLRSCVGMILFVDDDVFCVISAAPAADVGVNMLILLAAR